MTRLRLGVHDSSLVDPNIKTLEGVKGVILTSDQVQVVFWARKAHRAAKAMSELLGEAPVQDAAEIAAQNKTSVKKAETNLRRATISRQIRHHLHAADPRFYCRRSAAGDSDVNCHGDARSGRCSGHATRRAEFYEGVQQRFVHFPRDSGGL